MCRGGWCNQERARINGEKPRKHGLIFCASSSRQRTRRGARDCVDGGDSRVFRRRPCVRVRLRRGKPVRTVRFGVCIACLSVCLCVNEYVFSAFFFSFFVPFRFYLFIIFFFSVYGSDRPINLIVVYVYLLRNNYLYLRIPVHVQSTRLLPCMRVTSNS